MSYKFTTNSKIVFTFSKFSKKTDLIKKFIIVSNFSDIVDIDVEKAKRKYSLLSQKLPEFPNKHLSYLILKVNNIEFKVMDRIMFIWQY